VRDLEKLAYRSVAIALYVGCWATMQARVIMLGNACAERRVVVVGAGLWLPVCTDRGADKPKRKAASAVS
jgi:hypothetical protein